MQIVIDIDEETLQDLYDSRYVSSHIKDVFRSATPLQKGHGRLIDADDIDNHIIGHVDTRSCPTIIEADK